MIPENPYLTRKFQDKSHSKNWPILHASFRVFGMELLEYNLKYTETTQFCF